MIGHISFICVAVLCLFIMYNESPVVLYHFDLGAMEIPLFYLISVMQKLRLFFTHFYKKKSSGLGTAAFLFIAVFTTKQMKHYEIVM